MMDRDAWERFSKSGKVSDYLEYARQKRNNTAEAKSNEDEHRRSGHKSNGHG